MSVLLAPWDVLVFVPSDSWGTTFVFGRYVSIQSETQLLNPLQLFQAYLGLGESGTVGLAVTAIWGLCSLVATMGVLLVLYRRKSLGSTTVRDDRIVGAAFIASATVFAVSRLVITVGGYLDWTSLPIGAVYVGFVGVVFYFGLFRLGGS